MASAELPLRIISDEKGNLAIRCLCGAELAAVRRLDLQQEFSPAGLLRMVLHSRSHKNDQMVMT